MQLRVLLVVVIYETSLNDSITLQSLRRIKESAVRLPDVLVYDNSAISKYTSEFSDVIDLYHHNPDNSGVSGAYNYGCRVGLKKNKVWLVLLDQDTNIPFNYFSSLQSAIEQFPDVRLFCPIVKSNNTIVSPTYFIAKKSLSKSSIETGRHRSNHYTVINSGVCIQLSELQKLGGFDSDLPLDYSDHYFFKKYKKRNSFFCVIDCVVYHSLSSYSDQSFEKVFGRFKKFSASTYIYSRKTRSSLPVFWLYVRGLKLSLKFKRLEFIKCILSKK